MSAFITVNALGNGVVSLARNNAVSEVPSTPKRAHSLPAECPGAPSHPAKRVSSNGTLSNISCCKKLF